MPSDNGSLSGPKTAMIVVDMQNAFLNDDGSMNKGGIDITELKKPVLPVSNLIIACRRTL
jgi:nicotinamidase-related amidase